MEIQLYNRMKSSGLMGNFIIMFEHLYIALKGRPTSKFYLLFLNGMGKESFPDHQLIMINSLFARPTRLSIRKTEMVERIEAPRRLNDNARIDHRFMLFKSYAQGLQFSEDILSRVSMLSHLVPERTLGVHIRLTDMNIIHPNYGIFSYEDYLNRIKDYVEKYEITTIYVASDNWESILKLVNDLPGIKINYLESAKRVNGEEDDNLAHQYRMFKDKEMLTETIVDALLLAKCTYLIHRISNYANFALLRSKSIKHSYNLSVRREYA